MSMAMWSSSNTNAGTTNPRCTARTGLSGMTCQTSVYVAPGSVDQESTAPNVPGSEKSDGRVVVCGAPAAACVEGSVAGDAEGGRGGGSADGTGAAKGGA